MKVFRHVRMKGEEFSQSRISSLTIETHGEDKAEWLWGQNNARSKPGKVNKMQGRKGHVEASTQTDFLC